jgi:hypothetical protein
MSSDTQFSSYGGVQEDQDPRYQSAAQFPKARRKPDKKSAFSVNSDVRLNLDFDMALALGKFIIDSRSENTAIMALGHQLVNLGEEHD